MKKHTPLIISAALILTIAALALAGCATGKAYYEHKPAPNETITGPLPLPPLE